MASMIPTAGGNSRLAALQARKRPTVDVSEQGIAIQSGGGRSPLLTNRVDALEDDALAGVQQRGFSSGREAIASAMDAGQRTFRTGLIDQDFERLDEAASIERRMAEADALHKQRVGNAVGALRARGEHDVYFSPEAGAMRAEDQRNKLSLAGVQQSGALAKANADTYGADADVEIARIRAAADEAETRLGGGSRALSALAQLRSGLQEPTPAKRGALGGLLPWGAKPAEDPDAAVREQYDQEIQRLLQTLGFGQRGGTPAPMEQGGDAQQVGMPAEQPAEASQGDTVRALQIKTFAQRHSIDDAAAEAILLRHGVIQ